MTVLDPGAQSRQSEAGSSMTSQLYWFMLFLTRHTQIILSCFLTTFANARLGNSTTIPPETNLSAYVRVSSGGKMLHFEYHITYSTSMMEMTLMKWMNEDKRPGSCISVDELISTVTYQLVAQASCLMGANPRDRLDALVLFCSIFRNRGWTDYCLEIQLVSLSCV